MRYISTWIGTEQNLGYINDQWHTNFLKQIKLVRNLDQTKRKSEPNHTDHHLPHVECNKSQINITKI